MPPTSSARERHARRSPGQAPRPPGREDNRDGRYHPPGPVLAILGGLTRTVGNRLTIPFGLIGGAAFAIASATIPYTDTFDSLFKIGSLLAVWAILTGVIAIRQQT